jgi:Secretion system C-terminal sorting domain
MITKRFKALLIICLSIAVLWGASDTISFNIVVSNNPIDHCGLADVSDSLFADNGPITFKCLVKDMGVTDNTGASSLISAELGINLSNNTPTDTGWVWFSASYQSEDNTGEIYAITVPVDDIPLSGQFYLLSRFALPDSQYVYGGYDLNTNTGGIWDGTNFTAPLIHFIQGSAIEDVPYEFALHAPYPNPFNPGTRIDFDIPEDTQLDLKLYDLSGKKVQEIWSGHCSAGYYSKYIDMSNFASGIYVVQMITPAYRHIHKLLLVK